MEDADAFLASLLQFSSPTIDAGIQQQQGQRSGAVTSPGASASSTVTPRSSQQQRRRRQRDDGIGDALLSEGSPEWPLASSSDVADRNHGTLHRSAASVSSPAPAAPPSHAQNVRSTNSSGTWWCARCTAGNTADMLSCALCHRRRHRVEGPPPTSSSGSFLSSASPVGLPATLPGSSQSFTAPPADARGEWPGCEPVVVPGPGEVSCPRCTFFNSSSRRTCEMCDGALPPSSSHLSVSATPFTTTANDGGAFQGAIGTPTVMPSGLPSGLGVASASSVPSTVLAELRGHGRQLGEGSPICQRPVSPKAGPPVALQECDRATLSFSPVSVGSRSTQSSSSNSSDSDDDDDDDVGESGDEWCDERETAAHDTALQSVKFDTLPCAAVPATMQARAELRPFQLQALHWLLSREQPQCPRTRVATEDTVTPMMKMDLANSFERGAQSCGDGGEDVCYTGSGRPASGTRGGALCQCGDFDAEKCCRAASASRAMRPASSLPTDGAIDMISSSGTEGERSPLPGGQDTMRAVRGGVFADYMGLGKTRTLIALCEAARHPRIDRVTGSLVESTATLVVCPASLLSQWEREIKHCVERPVGAPLRILVYYGARKRRLSLFQVAQSYDYVLTTYQTLCHNEPPVSRFGPRDNNGGLTSSGGVPAAMATDLSNLDDFGADSSSSASAMEYDVDRRLQTKVGTLFMIRWGRIILDEAHYIRNMRTHQSRACLKLSGVCRWVVTATPVQNSLNDLFPLLRFLDVPHFSSLSWWNNEIVRYYNLDPHHPRPVTALSILFGSILLRRTPDSIVDGKPILALPPKRTITHTVKLSREETRFYQSIHTKATEKLNALRDLEAYATRTPLATFTTAFEMLVRCRQTCLHPYIVVAALRRCHRLPSAEVDTSGGATLTGVDLVSATSSVASSEAAQKQQREADAQRTRLIDAFIQTVVLRRLRTIKTREFVQSLVDEIKHQKLESRECIICLDTVNRPAILPCAHVFCEECIMHALGATRRCPLCKRNSKPSELLLVPMEVLQRTTQGPQAALDGGSRGADSRPNTCDMAPEVPLSLDLTDMSNWNIQLSSKTQYLIDTIRRLPADDKVVVFSSFLVYLRCAEHWLRAAGVSCAIYSGSMTMKQKQTLLELFHNAAHPASPRVLLATTSSCGVGLNLTCANHCFLMEPSWNPGTEEQALNRIYRIGQTKAVTITKLIADDTVEQNISQLCERKRALSGYCFRDGVAGVAAAGGGRGEGGDGRLRTSDLLELFAPEKSTSSSVDDDSTDDSSDEDEDE
ncbi:hypothetical protein JKF63_03606 [Porcisia hertigi]|uniref:RanBP-type and C3HC4-type zinc finger-containing protein 1 n=1 Tax=Porcisia hertigi TaxID=2761500 RepID=A0A836L880_9TRYP|nr:hypothetical protein JKF63_03606 [Porcisia hertigi]